MKYSRRCSMALIRKRRIWWHPVEGAAGYVVYVSKDESVFDPQNFKWEKTPGVVSKAVDGTTELIVPDNWAEFPQDPGVYYVAITTRDEAGNESDPFVSHAFFRFTAPPSPSWAGIESV